MQEEKGIVKVKTKSVSVKQFTETLFKYIHLAKIILQIHILC
jgi:hypothetical protein